MNVVCVLTARKDSKGYPGKNLLEINGKRLFEWVVLEASNANAINSFHVNTDSEEIIQWTAKHGWGSIPRPSELATDTALSEEVFIQSLDWIEKNIGLEVDLLVLLMANSPTFTSKEIDKAVKILIENPEYDSAVTVSKYNMWSPIRARKINSSGLLEPFVPLDRIGELDAFNSGRDSQGDVWFADMGFSVVRSRNLRNIEYGQLPQRWMGKNIYPITHEGGLDLDYPYQVGQLEWWILNQSIK
jgi:hypothetical protein